MRLLASGALIAALLAACGDANGPQPAAGTPAADTPAATTAATPAVEDAAQAAATAPPALLEGNVSEAYVGDLDGMIERRVIRALVPFSKTFYFVDLGGTQRGISYEYMKAFEDDLNQRLKTGHVRVHVVFVPTTRDQMPALLEAGRGDIAAVDATIGNVHVANFAFTVPIATGIKELVVTGPGAPAIAGLDDLAGKTVYVSPQSSRETHLRALSDQLVARGLAPIDVQLAPAELEPEDLLEMVNAGLLPAVAVNRYYGVFWSKIFPDLVVREDLVISDSNDIGFAVRKGNPRLKAELDAFLESRAKGSTFGNVTIRSYLDNTKWVKNATNEAEMAKFRELIGLFQTYSERYGVDWVLMAAQGYQESRLDQSVRSPVGAIGVMQVMPATGADMKVGDISERENNIHAGIKYVRWVMDEYYKDEPMTEKNKMLFAFASYNAGPGRVRGLRKVAAERGLDPNVWFNNVEHVAAEKIGRETVQYVSNIYKYYIAYTLAKDRYMQKVQAEAAKD